MTDDLGRIPPPDPQRAQALRAAHRQQTIGDLQAVLLLMLQAVAALVLGAWAGAAGDSASSVTAEWGAVGMFLLLLGANTIAYGLLLMLGSVSLVAMLPRLFRRRPADAPPPAGERLARIAVFAIWLGHAAMLLLGSLLLLVLLSLAFGEPGWPAWWRFVLAALGLAALSGRLLIALDRANVP